MRCGVRNHRGIIRRLRIHALRRAQPSRHYPGHRAHLVQAGAHVRQITEACCALILMKNE